MLLINSNTTPIFHFFSFDTQQKSFVIDQRNNKCAKDNINLHLEEINLKQEDVRRYLVLYRLVIKRLTIKSNRYRNMSIYFLKISKKNEHEFEKVVHIATINKKIKRRYKAASAKNNKRRHVGEQSQKLVPKTKEEEGIFFFWKKQIYKGSKIGMTVLDRKQEDKEIDSENAYENQAMSFWRMTMLLVWKNYMMQCRRRPKSWLCKVLLPAVFFGILGLLRIPATITNQDVQLGTGYDTYNFTSPNSSSFADNKQKNGKGGGGNTKVTIFFKNWKFLNNLFFLFF
ncbi:hypothetical protein RFI_06060 [Reticulomyxa filosa]|uniref:Uncharacterized protein n=1 Tax=Reticulomyxa filosa TaxID=46433 RepID=X6P0K5_RETFI|nr:hypothetical protein RFI_06060 [Reticulomyxa filosa]|eukprot:ETO31062.1 hypothetical protein RFI_06060 [Reticulomyxa filosa]